MSFCLSVFLCVLCAVCYVYITAFSSLNPSISAPKVTLTWIQVCKSISIFLIGLASGPKVAHAVGSRYHILLQYCCISRDPRLDSPYSFCLLEPYFHPICQSRNDVPVLSHHHKLNISTRHCYGLWVLALNPVAQCQQVGLPTRLL